MSTTITLVVQKRDKRGDALPDVTLIKDSYKFETDAQADDYFGELMVWLDERPIPDPEIHPFPRKKARDPMEVEAIIEDMITPECLHLQN